MIKIAFFVSLAHPSAKKVQKNPTKPEPEFRPVTRSKAGQPKPRPIVGSSVSIVSDNPPRPGGAQRPRRPQQALQDRGLWDVEVRERGRRGDRDAARQECPAHQVDGAGVAHLFALHHENRRLELRHLDVGDRDAR